MHYSYTSLLLTGLVAASTLVSAAPQAKRGFSLPAVKKRNHGCVPRKKTGNMKPEAATTTDIKGVSQSNYWYDQQGEFMAELTIGGQKMRIELDTGSGDFFVMSTNQKNFPEYVHMSNNTRYYDPKSKTANFKHLPGLSYDTVFSDKTGINCSTSGMDFVEMGGITVPNQTFSLVDSCTGSWQEGGRDGLMGLKTQTYIKNESNPEQDVAPYNKNFVLNAHSQGLIPEKIIAMYFKDEGGWFDIGKIDMSRYSGDIKWVKTMTNPGEGEWVVPLSTFTVGSETIDCNSTDIGYSYVDSGNTLMSVTPDMAEAFYKQIPGSKRKGWNNEYWSLPCDAKFPSFKLDFGTATVEVEGTPEVMIRDRNDDNTKCMGSIQESKRVNMGTYFIRSQYTIFDYGKGGASDLRIGFAKRK